MTTLPFSDAFLVLVLLVVEVGVDSGVAGSLIICLGIILMAAPLQGEVEMEVGVELGVAGSLKI